jgi:hypothetical protein
MDFHGGSSKLHLALKNLLICWDETKARWSDPVSQAFEETHLVPLESQVEATRKAIDRLAQTLHQAHHECR